MRRKTVIVILLLSALAFSALCLAACDRDSSEDDRPKDISRMVSAFYAGENEDFAVTFERGSKEEPFIADGKTTTVADFSSLRVTPLRTTEVSEISFVLSGAAGESVSGKLTAGTFGEFRAEVAAEFAPVKVTLTAGELTREIDFARRSIAESNSQSNTAVANMLGAYLENEEKKTDRLSEYMSTAMKELGAAERQNAERTGETLGKNLDAVKTEFKAGVADMRGDMQKQQWQHLLMVRFPAP